MVVLLDPIELRESVFNKLTIRGDFVKITLKIS